MKLKPVVKAIAVVLSVAAVPNLFAQQGKGSSAPVVARLVIIEGDALASTESGLIAVTQGASFADGTRVMTMAKSRGTIEYVDGCRVELDPNMRVEIRLDIPCAARQRLAMQTVLDPATQLAVEGGLSSPGNIPGLVLSGDAGAMAGFVIGGGVVIAINNRPNDSVSPN